MKRFYKLLLPLSIIVTAVTSQATAKTVKHTIKNGETLFTIAQKNRTTISEVRKANGLKIGDNLKIGRVLTVPKDTYNAKTKTKIVKASSKTKRKKLAKTKKKVTKKRVAKKRVTKRAKSKKIRMAKTKTSRNERKLAKTLNRVKFKQKSKKSDKFSFSDILFSAGSNKKSANITNLAQKKLGRRYVWGATGKGDTYDCSGFTTYVCKKNGISIPRTSRAQSSYGKYISRNNLKPGDLIFFDTSKRRKGYVNHVGIYLGNDKFIHASSAKKKVVISKLGKSFYSKRYKGARRVTS